MKRILFPTDFSPAADSAMEVAFNLAKNAQAELVIFHALNTVQQFMEMNITSGADLLMPTVQPELVQEIIQSHRKIAEQKLAERAHKAEEKGVWYQTVLNEQSLDVCINEVIDEKNIGFVVMGTHGASGIAETLIGSNAQKVVRRATVPVLTLNGNVGDLTIRRIAFFSDFLDSDTCDQIPRVQRFASWFNAELSYVFVNTPNYFEPTHVVQKRMSEVITAHGGAATASEIYNDFDIAEGVINYSVNNEVSIIALVTHGFSGLKKLFNDNVTESVVNHSKIPVLSLHIPKDN